MPAIKMLSSLNKISKIILLVSSFALFCSCTRSKSDKVNSNFLKQYGNHIEKINSQISGISEKDIQNMLEIFIDAENKMKYNSIVQLPLELATIDITTEKR